MTFGLNSNEFCLFKNFIEEHCGISICEEKAYLIESRLSKLLIDTGVFSFEEFYNKVTTLRQPEMIERIIDSITTNETLWFRDLTPWNILEDFLLPKYIDEFKSGARDKVRIWSAASSTGQEPYSIAMCIHNYLRKHLIGEIKLSDFDIIGSDISRTVLEIAKAGKYDNISIIRGLSDSYRDKYFVNQGRVWTLDEEIRKSVRFTHFNLQNSFSGFGKFDIIFCRYVVIYFSQKLKNDVMHKIAGSLKRDGVLFIGNSELLIDYEKDFELKRYNNGVFYQLKE